MVLALVCGCTNVWHLELEMASHKPENKSWHPQQHCLTLRGEVITSHEDKIKSRSGPFFTVTLSFLCFYNSKSSTGPAVQNAGHWSRMPHLCGGSPQPPVHPRVVWSRRGWRGEETVPAAEHVLISIEALILMIFDFLLVWSPLPRYQISSWKRESTLLSSGKVGGVAPYRMLLEVHTLCVRFCSNQHR